MRKFWNQRYAEKFYAYGEEPNAFLKKELSPLKPASILFPAEGEGRNAVYAAKLGWNVFAFDQSEEGMKKAYALAEKNNVKINYTINSEDGIPFYTNRFDVISLIYAHFDASLRKEYHAQLISFLKPGGYIIFEAFSKQHLSYKNESAGGPKDEKMLFSIQDIKDEFPGVVFKKLIEEEIILTEGKYHNGLASVIRFLGIKKETRDD